MILKITRRFVTPKQAAAGSKISSHLRHSLEEVEEKLKEERIKIRHERNKFEKGLPQIPMPAHSVPFFKERPEVQKVSSIMQVILCGTVSHTGMLACSHVVRSR